MTTITTTIELPGAEYAVDPAELAAVAFLARYSGRTLDAYPHDLRNLFQWAADHGLPVLEASRAHLEIYRSSMEGHMSLARPLGRADRALAPRWRRPGQAYDQLDGLVGEGSPPRPAVGMGLLRSRIHGGRDVGGG